MSEKKSFTKELLWIYAVGLAGMIIPFTRPYFMIITPVNLLVVTGILLYNHSIWNTSSICALAVVGVLAFSVEAVGVNTGLIFGDYSYGATLGPKLINTPLMIGVNWIVLVYICHSIAVSLFDGVFTTLNRGLNQRLLKTFLVAVIGAMLMVGYDFILEPSAIELDMWTWAEGVIPLSNYVAWYGFSFVFIMFLDIMKVDTKNPTALPVYLIQLLFFLVLDIWFLVL